MSVAKLSRLTAVLIKGSTQARRAHESSCRIAIGKELLIRMEGAEAWSVTQQAYDLGTGTGFGSKALALRELFFLVRLSVFL